VAESDWPVTRNKMTSLICRLWNLKSFTVDYCAPSIDDHRSLASYFPHIESDLSVLREVISYKIAQLLSLSRAKIPSDFFRLVQGGKDIGKLADLDANMTLFVELKGSLKGGKGGFGSLLRSIKPKAKEDENFEACRDLSGRRLRHVYNEQRLLDFQKRQEEEEKYVQEELKEYEKTKNQLKGAIQANNYKLDDAYVK